MKDGIAVTGVVPRRFVLGLLVLVLTGAGIYRLSWRLYAHILYQQAGTDMVLHQPERAIARLEKAVDIEPFAPYLWTRLGEAFHLLAETRPLREGLTLLQKEQVVFAKAFSLNKLDAEPLFLQAMATALEEKVYGDVCPNCAALPPRAKALFMAVLDIRPGGFRYLHAFARYLYQIGDMAYLGKTVGKMTFFDPGIVGTLKREPFWTEEPIQAAAERGIEAAIRENRNAERARQILDRYWKQPAAPS